MMMGRERRVKKTVVMGQSEDMEGTKSEELPGMSGVKHRATQIRSQKGTGLGRGCTGAVTSDM